MKKINLFVILFISLCSSANSQIVMTGKQKVIGGSLHSYTLYYSPTLESETILISASNGSLRIGNKTHDSFNINFYKTTHHFTFTVLWNDVEKNSDGVIKIYSIENPHSNYNHNVNIFSKNPAVSNINTSITGTLYSFNFSTLSLSFSTDQSERNYEVRWTVHDGGTKHMSSWIERGSEYRYMWKSTGTATISAELRFVGGTEIHYTATRNVSIGDGTLETPFLSDISGSSRFGVGSQGHFGTNSYLFSNISYEWKINNLLLPDNSAGMIFDFFHAGTFNITCKATNTKTGKVSNTVSKVVTITSGGAIKSLSASDTEDNYNIVNDGNTLIISDDNQKDSSMANPIKSYQIYDLKTGVLFDSGTISIIDNNFININTLPKGMYVLIVNDGIKKVSHKFVKK